MTNRIEKIKNEIESLQQYRDDIAKDDEGANEVVNCDCLIFDLQEELKRLNDD
jgi:hypothetical protein